jgi:hypothetical protein
VRAVVTAAGFEHRAKQVAALDRNRGDSSGIESRGRGHASLVGTLRFRRVRFGLLSAWLSWAI